MSTEQLLILGAFVFCSGLFIALTKKNSIFILIGIELMLNASNINFVAFSQRDSTLQGQMAAIFIMVIAAAETAVALAILFKIYRHYQSSDLKDANELKG
ncbi:MAG: NADH-quinone oxidoreductase subunit NuoK [Cyclobacteriaceae bacterium]